MGQANSLINKKIQVVSQFQRKKTKKSQPTETTSFISPSIENDVLSHVERTIAAETDIESGEGEHINKQIAVVRKAPTTTTMSTKFALGAGCYWGTEKYMKVDFQKKFPNSINKIKVGFMSPDANAKRNPTYREVCSGRTGFVEVANIELSDPKYFEDAIKFFFQFHDPTTPNAQGNDRGTQYASYIFTSDETQAEIARRVKQDLQTRIDQKKIVCYMLKQVTTKITSYTKFHQAHAAHQNYLHKNPKGYCNHRIRFKSW